MYIYELHQHTSACSGCGAITPEELPYDLKREGYAGAVITDHFIGGNTRGDRSLPWDALVESYASGYRQGLALARELDFDLMFGVEEGYGGGKEFLVYGIEPEFLLSRPFLRDAEIAFWSREGHAVGGVLIYAHPFRMRDYISDPNAMPDMTLADGVELYNRGNPVEQDQKAVDTFAGEDWIFIAGGDTHNDLFTERFGVELPCEVSTSAELAAALKRKEHTLLHKR